MNCREEISHLWFYTLYFNKQMTLAEYLKKEDHDL